MRYDGWYIYYKVIYFFIIKTMLKLVSNSLFCELDVCWWSWWWNSQETIITITTPQQEIKCQQLNEFSVEVKFLWEREFNWFVECVKQLDNQWLKQPLFKRLLVKLNLYLTKIINDRN